MVKRRQVGVWFPSSLKGGVWRALPWMWGCFQRLPQALFGRAHRIEGGGMTLLLRHSSGAQALGAEFSALRLASSVVCSMLLRGCLCSTIELRTESPGADSRRSAWPYRAVGHCVEAWPPSPQKYSCTSSSTALSCWGCAASSSGVMMVGADLGIFVPHSTAKPRNHWGTEKLTQISQSVFELSAWSGFGFLLFCTSLS